jgi:hypothetical protein
MKLRPGRRVMPPHCDALDGPVVKAARAALEAADVGLILPYVKREGEAEVLSAFERVLPMVGQGGPVKELAETYFFETVVRVHRAGEHAPYTGLKPAGLDVGPVIPVAERSIESGSPDELAKLLTAVVSDEVRHRHKRMLELASLAKGGTEAAREYVEAMLGLQVWSNNVYRSVKASAHGEQGDHAD